MPSAVLWFPPLWRLLPHSLLQGLWPYHLVSSSASLLHDSFMPYHVETLTHCQVQLQCEMQPCPQDPSFCLLTLVNEVFPRRVVCYDADVLLIIVDWLLSSSWPETIHEQPLQNLLLCKLDKPGLHCLHFFQHSLKLPWNSPVSSKDLMSSLLKVPNTSPVSNKTWSSPSIQHPTPGTCCSFSHGVHCSSRDSNWHH